MPFDFTEGPTSTQLTLEQIVDAVDNVGRDKQFVGVVNRLNTKRLKQYVAFAPGHDDDSSPADTTRRPDRRIGWRDQRIDREIATPIAAGSVRSAVGGLHGRQLRLQNLRHNRHCGAAIPRPDRMPSVHPDGRIAPKNARSMRQGSSRPPESTQTNREGSRFPHELRFGSQALVNR